MIREPRWTVSYMLALLWVATTVSLAGWWLFFGLSQAERIQELGGEAGHRLGQVQRMLVWEGTVLLALLLGGGVALMVAIRREARRRQQLQDFFALFTHDLKTALASLQLQAESLQEDLGPDAGGEPLRRLMRDALRLRLQLENSLYYAQPDAALFPEPVDVRGLVTRLAEDWPDLAVAVQGDAQVLADRRAVEGIVRNVLQNASVHGGASRVEVAVGRLGPAVTVSFDDNGRGASAKVLRALAVSDWRPAATSGTGLGLLISRRLVARMQGSLQLSQGDAGGVRVVLSLPEAA